MSSLGNVVARRRVAFSALCTAAALCALSQRAESQGTRAAITPDKAASAFIPSRLARIDSLLSALTKDQRIAGATALIVKDGFVVYNKAFGVRDLSTNVPQKPDDIFRIASQTKAITSIAAMMLYEEGRFQLDDPIGMYLPEFGRATVLTTFKAADSTYETKPSTRRITIRNLLTHTSGIDYPSIGSEEFRAIYAKAGVQAGIGGVEGDVLADKIKVLAKLPLKHEPGEKFTYGLSVDVIGRLVEVLSGVSLDQFFRTRIFEPLKMRDTYFALPSDKFDRLAGMHVERNGKLSAMSASNVDFAKRPVTYFSGGSGLSSTTGDYARFLQMLMNGGELDGTRLLGRKTIEMMLTNQVGTIQPNFGLGFQLETPSSDFRTPLTERSFTWGGAINTTYWADPKEHLVALVYTNVSGSTVRLGDLFKTLVYAAMK